MTIKELSRLHDIKRDIESCREQIATLEARATKASSTLSGMPFGSGISDKTGLGAEIADLRARLESDVRQAEEEYIRTSSYIQDVEDPLVRSIMRYRFLDGLSWLQVGMRLGSGTPESTVRSIVKAYLKKH